MKTMNVPLGAFRFTFCGQELTTSLDAETGWSTNGGTPEVAGHVLEVLQTIFRLTPETDHGPSHGPYGRSVLLEAMHHWQGTLLPEPSANEPPGIIH